MTLPWLGLWVEAPWAHPLFLLMVFPVAAISFYRSYRYHHRLHRLPIALAIMGIIILALNLFLDQHRSTAYHIAPIFGGLFVVAAHYLNIKSCGK